MRKPVERDGRPNGEQAEAVLSVLVADDDPLIAEYLCLALEALDCVVMIVGDGRAALERLRAQRFDVLITDWMMPEMDGIELVRQARTVREDHLHVILMTARGEQRTLRMAVEAGVDDFIYKPFDDMEIELGINSARRVVRLQRVLKLRNRHLAKAHDRTRAAYRQLKDDLVAAAEMQRRLLPVDELTGALRHASVFTPSLDIGGDTLGVLRVAGGRQLFFDIDVSGHGVPAALNSFALHSRLARLAPSTPEELEDAARVLNDELLAQEGDTYMTAVLGLREADDRRLWLLRAGHPLPILCTAAGAAEFLEHGGLPLGMLPDVRHEVLELMLSPGDRLLIYSDGATEGGLGEAGLLVAFDRLRTKDLQTALGALEERLVRMRGGRPPVDDISMLALEVAPSPVLESVE